MRTGARVAVLATIGLGAAAPAAWPDDRAPAVALVRSRQTAYNVVRGALDGVKQRASR